MIVTFPPPPPSSRCLLLNTQLPAEQAGGLGEFAKAQMGPAAFQILMAPPQPKNETASAGDSDTGDSDGEEDGYLAHQELFSGNQQTRSNRKGAPSEHETGDLAQMTCAGNTLCGSGIVYCVARGPVSVL